MIESAQQLVETAPDTIEMRDCYDNTPLFVALQSATGTSPNADLPELVRLLLAKRPTAAAMIQSSYNKTPLHLIASGATTTSMQIARLVYEANPAAAIAKDRMSNYPHQYATTSEMRALLLEWHTVMAAEQEAFCKAAAAASAAVAVERAEAMQKMDASEAALSLLSMPQEDRAAAMGALSPEDRARVLSAMTEGERAAVLILMTPGDREQTLVSEQLLTLQDGETVAAESSSDLKEGETKEEAPVDAEEEESEWLPEGPLLEGLLEGVSFEDLLEALEIDRDIGVLCDSEFERQKALLFRQSGKEQP